MHEPLKTMTAAEFAELYSPPYGIEVAAANCDRIALALRRGEEARRLLWEIVEWIDNHATFRHFEESGWSEIGSRAAKLLKGGECDPPR